MCVCVCVRVCFCLSSCCVSRLWSGVTPDHFVEDQRRYYESLEELSTILMCNLCGILHNPRHFMKAKLALSDPLLAPMFRGGETSVRVEDLWVGEDKWQKYKDENAE